MSRLADATAARVAEVQSRVTAACGRAGRDPAEVTVIAVAKTHGPEDAQAVVDAGLVDLGENRVQELTAKAPLVTGGTWHLIGPLQRNKARDAMSAAALIHTLDRRSLADSLSRIATEEGRVVRTLVQVNVGDDPAKHGCDVDGALDLVAYARALPNVVVEGFMTVPPLPDGGAIPGEAARPHFHRLRDLRDTARARWPEVVSLSMGMSADLDAAVEEGATHVRVGTAIFGQREAGAWHPDRTPIRERTQDTEGVR